MQKIAKIFLLSGNEVFIITSRFDNEVKNNEVFMLAHILGIKSENIHFTNHEFKWKTVNELGIELHFDDNEEEVHLINANSGTALLFNLDAEMLKELFLNFESGKLQRNEINQNKI